MRMKAACSKTERFEAYPFVSWAAVIATQPDESSYYAPIYGSFTVCGVQKPFSESQAKTCIEGYEACLGHSE